MMKYLLLALFLLGTFLSNAQSPNRNQNNLTLFIKPDGLVGKDASVWSNNANGNYANNQAINVYTWTNGGALGVKRAYIVFGLSALPATAVIDSVFLNLFYDPISYEGFKTHSGTTTMEVNRVTTPWNESTITWNNQPNVTNMNQVSVAAHTSPTQNYHIDVTQLVNDQRTTGNTNYGFQIRMQDEINYYRGVLLASSDHIDSNLRPELKVYYNISTGLSKQRESLASALEVYPNPSNESFTINFTDELVVADFQIQLFDMIGNEVDVNLQDSKINLRNHPSGIYFIRLTDKKGQSFSKKIVLR